MWRDRHHTGSWMTRAAPLLLLTFMTAACTGAAVPEGSSSLEHASHPGSTPVECPAASLEGELLRDDASGFLVRHAEGFVTPIVWPDGYSVRNGEVRELLDPTGAVVAREGDSVSLGGGMIGNDEAFGVCGPFTVTPAD